MKLRLTIYPCVYSAMGACITLYFETECELFAAESACANLLLFLQGQLRAMDDESNIFICEQFINGEWEELTND